MTVAEAELKETLVTFRASNGASVRAGLLRFAREVAVVEVYSPGVVIRTSDVLDPFCISSMERVVYSGRALVSSVVNTGTLVICELTLDASGLNVTPIGFCLESGATLQEEFRRFVTEWQATYRVRPEFKDVIGDMQSFLSELRFWLDQVDLEIRSFPAGDRLQKERQVIDQISRPIIDSIDGFVARFEGIAHDLEQDLRPAHRAYLRRQLHPFILCSPFAYRAFQKPLGYAGDYETVDKMLRPPYEGSTLFAKLVNVWLLDQAPASAHRKRIERLGSVLVEEAARAGAEGRTARIYNLGCGCATEVQRFILKQALADRTEFTLVDFNAETLDHVRTKLEAAKRAQRRSTAFCCLQRSVQSIIKGPARGAAQTPEGSYDLVYCAGLFDYLSGSVCKRLLSILYDMLAPGGLLLATNVSAALNDSRPFRYSMEYMLDWHLVYRNGAQVLALAPEGAPLDSATVRAEETGVNIFLEIRKPRDAR